LALSTGEIQREREEVLEGRRMSAHEPHYKPREIAEMWKWSVKTVIRIFQDEPGVLKLTRPATGSKRRWSTLSIPETVLFRVHQRLVVKK
jgi:hypothetical protein